MISKDDVKNLAELARLKLKDGEIESLQKDISNILGYVGQISSFSAANKGEEKPTLRNVLREDAPRADNDPMANKQEVLLQALPRREGNYNVVRKIIQKD